MADALSRDALLAPLAAPSTRFRTRFAHSLAPSAGFRARWDRGESTDLVVVLRAGTSDLRSLPWDLLEAGRKLEFSLGELFPELSYPVVASLDRTDLDALFVAQEEHRSGNLGENSTRDFILRHVFSIAPEVVKKPTDLLAVLLRRHHQSLRIPRTLDDRLIHVLRRSGAFADWPLETIVPDREAFFAFLQERWPLFLDELAADSTEPPDQEPDRPPLALPGPPRLPFEHDDVRVIIDTLFLEGLLEPVAHPAAPALDRTWAAVGLRADPAADRNRRWPGLVEAVIDAVPGPDARHQDWQSFAPKWAQLVVLRAEQGRDLKPDEALRFVELCDRVDAAFLAWTETRYGTLHNQPAVPLSWSTTCRASSPARSRTIPKAAWRSS